MTSTRPEEGTRVAVLFSSLIESAKFAGVPREVTLWGALTDRL
jgi:hypothetical protein